MSESMKNVEHISKELNKADSITIGDPSSG